ncbi:hypothetical protein AOLI_G00233570 [Acnodon oligacanthus]
MSSTDLDGLESGAARSGSGSRCRRMDACLAGSVLALFALTAAGFALALLFALALRTEVDSIKKRRVSDGPVLGLQRAETGSDYKAQSFAYLRATNSEVKPGVMLWESISYGNGQTVGSGYTYNSNHGTLAVEREGSYFLYTQLNMSCVHQCNSGSLTLTFVNQDNEQLSCTVKLPAKHWDPVVRKCWTVIPHLEKKSRLLARISLDTDLKNWQLDLNSSGFGMFLVDGVEKE